MKKHLRILLAGNPNCGKTSVFNALTGARQHVGNYAGVTVESKSGTFRLGEIEIELVDLPGVYSLSSSSPEERIAFKELTGKGVDLILNVIDSSIPRRSLYLTTQLAELHIPMLLVFNMSDDARKKGLKFDIPKLEKYFGSPIAQTVGRSKEGVEQLVEKLAIYLKNPATSASPMLKYSADIEDSICAVAKKIDALDIKKYAHIPSRFFAIKLIENDFSAMGIGEFRQAFDAAESQRKHLLEIQAIDESQTFMADARYSMLSDIYRDCISDSGEGRREISDKIDIVMTNKFLGLPLFFVIIYLTFSFTFTFAQPFMDWIEEGFNCLSDFVKTNWDAGTLPYMRSLLTDGVIGGVGGVLVFLPNILFLFFAIAILEDSGYMARAAFVMDAIMRRFGLQGRSFIPLILGFGCNVPAIMATRSIENERDRKTTIMVLPLMSCGARLPIYALIIPAFFLPKYQAATMCAIYLIGVCVALIGARILKNTVFKGEGEVYLMELPPYRLPTLRSLLLHMWDRGKMYLNKAGTIILATSILLYVANTFPEKTEFSKDYAAQIQELKKSEAFNETQTKISSTDEAFSSVQSEKAKSVNAAISALENEMRAEALEYTISGRVGKFLEPIFKPIGFDWKLTTASIGALAAKEVFVSQLGILYAEGDSDEESSSLRARLAANYTPLEGFCVMLFSLMSIPCLATLAVIKRELNSWKGAAAEAFGLFALAYFVAFVVYQIGSFFQIGTHIL